MPFYKLNGMPVHMKLSGKGSKNPPAPCHECGWISGYLCDWPVGDEGKSCDMPLCDAHRVEVGKNKDYCPRHAQQWREQNPQLALIGKV